MNKVDISVIKYLGKVNNGIMVLISVILIEEQFTFDATFFYTDQQMIVTITEEVEEIIGDVTKLPHYADLLRLCLKKVVPHNELIDNIDPLDVKPYVEAILSTKKPNE